MKNSIVAKKFVLSHHFSGVPTADDFQCQDEKLPQITENEILCEAVCLSVDPYMRTFTNKLVPPFTMIGSQVAKVVESKSEEYPEGCHVIGYFGWRTHTIVNVNQTAVAFKLRRLPERNVPWSYFLGACGMPGVTAYLGFTEFCRPQNGNTVVVTAAAGAVGSVVGQIAKLQGCRVVGVAGSEEKCNWIKELGFDESINYKQCPDLSAALRKAAPNGIDCYFDNVGGLISHIVREQMNDFGRVAVCGSISQYNQKKGEEVKIPSTEYIIVSKQLCVTGFVATRWDKSEKWMGAITAIAKWISEGKVKVKETKTYSFEEMPQAFIGLFNGKNIGKAIVEVKK